MLKIYRKKPDTTCKGLPWWNAFAFARCLCFFSPLLSDENNNRPSCWLWPEMGGERREKAPEREGTSWRGREEKGQCECGLFVYEFGLFIYVYDNAGFVYVHTVDSGLRMVVLQHLLSVCTALQKCLNATSCWRWRAHFLQSRERWWLLLVDPYGCQTSLARTNEIIKFWSVVNFQNDSRSTPDDSVLVFCGSMDLFQLSPDHLPWQCIQSQLLVGSRKAYYPPPPPHNLNPVYWQEKLQQQPEVALYLYVNKMRSFSAGSKPSTSTWVIGSSLATNGR